MELHGWGRYPRVTAEILEPVNSDSLRHLLPAQDRSSGLIARGAGRSYGDSALAATVVSSRFLDNFIAVDESNNAVHCGAGVTLDAILKIAIPRGWFLPVLPGTKFVSIGGAIAADIHGKNHHRDGSFCDHLVRFNLALASGEVVSCSKQENAELFHATCGGMGLTGVILDAELTFEKVSSVSIKRESLVASNLNNCIELLEANESSKYSVAWVDCLARNEALGRAIVHLGEHDDDSDMGGDMSGGKSGGERAGGENSADIKPKTLACKSRRGISVPFNTPALLLNRFTMSLFNSAYFHLKQRQSQCSTINYDAYFFPLDNIGNWNRLYGGKGFLQYQFVLPLETAARGMADILERVSATGKGSFLAVLKKFGGANANLLSFPHAGYTLTLDFKREKSLLPLLDELDRIVIANSGRHYLAKDARMSEDVFKAGYPGWEAFAAIKNRVDPEGLFASRQSDRLGLTQKK